MFRFLSSCQLVAVLTFLTTISEATKGKGIPLQQPTQSQSSRDLPESLMNFSKLALPCKIIYVYSNDLKEGKTHIISLRS